MAVDDGGAGRRCVCAREDVHQRRLTAPAATDDRDHLPRLHRKIEPLERDHLDVPLLIDMDEPLARNQRRHQPSLLISCTTSTDPANRRVNQATRAVKPAAIRRATSSSRQSIRTTAGGMTAAGVGPNPSYRSKAAETMPPRPPPTTNANN